MSVNHDAVFFYGLFMDPQLLRAKGLHPGEGRMAFVNDFALRIGQRATLVPAPESRVYGILTDLASAELEQLYAEPSVRAYRAEPILAHVTEGPPVPALCYNLPPGSDLGNSNPEYTAKLRELAARLQLPAHYVATIGPAPSAGT